MSQAVEVNGQKYRVWYKHYHQPETKDFMIEGFNEALELGQVRQHRAGMLTFVRGITLCLLEDDDRNVVAKGYAFCGENDNFNKKIGRAISLGRAKKALAG